MAKKVPKSYGDSLKKIIKSKPKGRGVVVYPKKKKKG